MSRMTLCLIIVVCFPYDSTVKKSSKRGYSDDEAPAGDADAPEASAAAADMNVDDADAVKMEEVADA